MTDPQANFANMSTSNDYCQGVLMLKFGDIDEECEDYPRLSPQQAWAIASFIVSNRHRAEAIVVNCDAGVSRSSAIGAAISYWINGSDKEIFDNPRYCPNRWVYRLVLDALLTMEIPEIWVDRSEKVRDRIGEVSNLPYPEIDPDDVLF